MKTLATLSVLILLHPGGSIPGLRAQESTTPAKKDPFNQVVELVELKDETIFDEIARLNQAFDISISIEGILPAKGTVANPKFTARIEKQTISDLLTWLCALDTRYTWSRDGNMINLFPRMFLNDKNYFFNRLLPELRFQDARDSGDAAIDIVHRLGDPNEHLIFMGIGGTQSFAKPWTATFHDITVRQALNRIAQQLGPTYGWQIGGTTNQRMIMFHYKLGARPNSKVIHENGCGIGFETIGTIAPSNYTGNRGGTGDRRDVSAFQGKCPSRIDPLLRKPALDPSSFPALFKLTHGRQATYQYSFDKQYGYGIMASWISENNPPIPMTRLEGSAPITPLLATHTRLRLCAAKCLSATPFVSNPYALFHFPYPVSPLLATHTKTAGCIPTPPILKLAPPPGSSPIGFPSSHPLESPRYTIQRTCTHRNEARA